MNKNILFCKHDKFIDKKEYYFIVMRNLLIKLPYFIISDRYSIIYSLANGPTLFYAFVNQNRPSISSMTALLRIELAIS